MQRLDLQFYALFMVILCGALLGLLSDLLRVVRGYYRPGRFLGPMADLAFWSMATVGLAGALFHGNWGELRLYVLLGLLTGIGLYYWLAGSLVRSLTWFLFDLLDGLARLIVSLLLRLVWAPLLLAASLIWAGMMLLWRTAYGLFAGVWRMATRLGIWMLGPLVRPYRCLRLRYLLFKRLWKRRIRYWLFGPPRGRWRK